MKTKKIYDEYITKVRDGIKNHKTFGQVISLTKLAKIFSDTNFILTDLVNAAPTDKFSGADNEQYYTFDEVRSVLNKHS